PRPPVPVKPENPVAAPAQAVAPARLVDPPQVVEPPKPADPPKRVEAPADNPRVTLAAFDKIKFLMPMKDIETIVGKGDRVDWDEVFDAVCATPDTEGKPYKNINGGLWVKWKGKDHTLFIQFPGDMNPDGTYSLGPKSQGCLM